MHNRILVFGCSTELPGARHRTAVALRWASRCLIALLVLAPVADAFAGGTTYTWTGGGSNADWTTVNNWGGSNPATDTGQANLTFAGTTQTTTSNNFAANTTFRTLVFSSAGFTLNGNTLNLGNNAGIANNATTGTNTINLGLALTAARTITTAAGGTTLVNGVISSVGVGTIAGAGTTIFAGTNTYTGATSISATSTLRITNAAALGGTTSGTTVVSGGALELADGITVGAEALSLAGTGISNGGALKNVSGTNTYGGIVTLTAAATIEADEGSELRLTNNVTGNFAKTFDAIGSIVASGTVSGSGGVTKTGAGLLTLSSTNSFTGALAVNAGTVRATTSASALGGATATLTLGGGDLALANDTGLAFSRNTTVSANGTIFSGRLTNGAGVNHTLGTLSIGAQTLSIATDATVTNGTAGLTFGTVTQTGASTFDVASGVSLTLGALQSAQSLTKQGAGTVVLNAAANAARTSGANIVSAGTMQLGSTSALGTTGATLTLNGGTLNLATDTSVNAYNTTVGGDATILSNKATAASAGITHTLGTLSIGANTLSIAAGGNATTGTPAITFGTVTQSGGSTFDVASGVSLTLGALQSAQSLTKQGAGTVVLNAAANAARTSGVNTVSAGTMQLGSTSALGTTGATLTLNGGTLNLATDTSVNAYNTTVGGDATILSNKASAASAGITHTLGTLSIGANTLSIAAGGNATTGTPAITFGAVTMSGSPTLSPAASTLLTLGALGDGGTGRTIVKGGAGTLTLGTAASSLVAGTILDINAGTVNVNNATAIGTNTAIDVADGATLSLGAAQTIAALTNTGSALNNGSVVIGNGFTLTVNNASANTFSGVVSGQGGLTKSNAGTLTLSAANTYTGATTISSGSVSASSIVVSSNASSLGNAASAVTLGGASTAGTLSYTGNSATYTRGFTLGAGGGGLNVTTAGQTLTVGTANVTGSGAFAVGGAGNVTVSSTLAQSGGLVKTGAGTLTLSSSNSYAGATSIEEGTLSASSIVVASSASSLGNAASAVTLGGASTAGTLSYTGNSATYTRGFTLGAGGGRFDVTTAGQTVTISTGSVGGTGLFSVGGAGNVNATAAISVVDGLTKTGAGTLTLTGANTFGGVLTGNAGVIRATTNAGALGAGLLTLAGSTLELANDTGLTFGRNTTVSANTTIFSERLTAGVGVTHTLGSLAIGGQTLTVDTDATVTSGTAGLTFASATLTGAATFSTGTATELTFSGGISGNFGLTKTGAGTLTLAGPGGYTNTTVSAGRLNVNQAVALGTQSGTLSMAAGTILGNTSGEAVSVLQAKLIQLGSSLTFAGPSNLNLGLGTATLSADTTFDVVTGTLALGGDVIGSFGLTKTGAGTLELGGLSGNSTYSGVTNVNAGTLELSGTSMFRGGSTVNINTGGTLLIGANAAVNGATLNFNGGQYINASENVVDGTAVFSTDTTLSSANSLINGPQIIETGVVVTTGSNWLGTIPGTAVADRIQIQNGGTLKATAFFEIAPTQGILLEGGTATFEVGGGSIFSMFVESPISGSGAFRKTGNGGTRLLGDNTYTGGTIIEEGALAITGGTSLGTGGVQIVGTELVAGTLADGTPTDVTINASQPVRIGNGLTSTISAQTPNAMRYAGVITEIDGGGAAGNLRIGVPAARAGLVALDGANTYRGSTSVRAGTLEVGVLANGGAASGIGQSSNAAANLVLEGGSVLRYTGANASTDRLFTLGSGGGTLDSGSGTLAFTNAGSAALAGTGARTFTLAGSGTGHLATILADLDPANKTSLTKTGLGTWELTSVQQYTGPTSIDGGSLLVNGSLASNVITAASTTLGGSGSIAGTVSGSGLVSPGNSPGIMTAGGFDPTSGLDAAFEFTQFNPNYGSRTDSGNDVLQLTNASAFGGAALSADNVIDVYFNVSTLNYLDAFEGGFVTGQDQEQLFAAVENAQFNFWFKTEGAGTRTFNGVNYNPLTYAFSAFSGARVETAAVNTTIGGDPVVGSVTRFVVVPEPRTLIVAGLCLAAFAYQSHRRHVRRRDRTSSL